MNKTPKAIQNQKIDAATAKRMNKALKPSASSYSKGNVDGGLQRKKKR